MSWACSRVKDVADLINGHPFDAADFADDGDLPLVRIRDILGREFETFVPHQVTPTSALIRDGDVVIGMDGDFNSVLWSRGVAALNQRVCVLRAKDSVDPRFLAFALPQYLQEINDLTYSTTVKHLSSRQIAEIRFPLPELFGQRAIADYLDRETAQIDTLIAKQKNLIATLLERRLATTAELALGAFDPLETTCVGTRVGTHFSVVLGKMLDAGRDPNPDDIELPYVRAANLQDRGLELTSVNTMAYSAPEASKLDLRAGDLLVVEGGAVGTSVLLDRDMPGWSFQKTVNRVRANGDASTAWLGYVLRAYRDLGVIDMICDGSTIAHFTAEKLRALRIPSIDSGRQRSIAAQLNRETTAIDTLIAKAEQFIALAKERRAALITAAVTGQIDVTGKAA